MINSKYDNASDGKIKSPIMNSLLNEYEQPDLKRGSVLEGTVVSVDYDGAWVSIGVKYEGFIPISEMHSIQIEGGNLPVSGDKVYITLIGWDSKEHKTLLSLDNARKQKGWAFLEKSLSAGETIQVKVIGANKGGLVATVDGITGFIPLSQVGERSTANNATQTNRIGELITVRVVELDRKTNRVILSERVVLREIKERAKERILAELKEGDIKKGKVTRVCDFGAFVDIGGAEGLVPLSEISWEIDKPATELLKADEEIDIKVIKIDKENKKITFSAKRAQPPRWDEFVSKYKEGQIITGIITNLTLFGAFVRVDGVEGLIHISELADKRITHPKEVVKKGDRLNLKILNIDPLAKRLRLSLKQAKLEEQTEEHDITEETMT